LFLSEFLFPGGRDLILVEFLQVRHGMRTATEMRPPVERLEGDTQAAYAAATQQFQLGQMELSGGNMGAATDAFRAACHFNPSAAAYTFMAWMQRLVSILLFE
jgi:cytochrome c-type biogenesis protein CcmH/NrfG